MNIVEYIVTDGKWFVLGVSGYRDTAIGVLAFDDYIHI